MIHRLQLLMTIICITLAATGCMEEEISYGDPIPVTIMCWNVEQFLARKARFAIFVSNVVVVVAASAAAAAVVAASAAAVVVAAAAAVVVSPSLVR